MLGHDMEDEQAGQLESQMERADGESARATDMSEDEWPPDTD